MSTIFRPYNSSSGQRSDRSAGDRLRHRQKVREAIRNNIADIIAEESIIGKDHNRIIKVPIRGVKEYRFIYGDNAPGVGQGGDGEPKPGDVVGQGDEGKAGQQAGNRPGVDYYETDVSLDELIDLMFEDLELPDGDAARGAGTREPDEVLGADVGGKQRRSDDEPAGVAATEEVALG